jgi:hypothetical protein
MDGDGEYLPTSCTPTHPYGLIFMTSKILSKDLRYMIMRYNKFIVEITKFKVCDINRIDLR